MEIVFKLQQQDAQVVLNVLGQLPTSSNVYPLLVNLGTQFQQQTTAAPVEPAAPTNNTEGN